MLTELHCLWLQCIITWHTWHHGKVHGANMGHIWGQQDSGGPHVGPMNLLSGTTCQLWTLLHNLCTDATLISPFISVGWLGAKLNIVLWHTQVLVINVFINIFHIWLRYFSIQTVLFNKLCYTHGAWLCSWYWEYVYGQAILSCIFSWIGFMCLSTLISA